MLEVTALLIERPGPEAIAIETAIAAGPAGGAERVQRAMGLRACVLAIAHRRRVRVEECHVPAIRKHFLGRSGTIVAEVLHGVRAAPRGRGPGVVGVLGNLLLRLGLVEVVLHREARRGAGLPPRGVAGWFSMSIRARPTASRRCVSETGDGSRRLLRQSAVLPAWLSGSLTDAFTDTEVDVNLR
jgi:hypothetical protein